MLSAPNIISVILWEILLCAIQQYSKLGGDVSSHYKYLTHCTYFPTFKTWSRLSQKCEYLFAILTYICHNKHGCYYGCLSTREFLEFIVLRLLLYVCFWNIDNVAYLLKNLLNLVFRYGCYTFFSKISVIRFKKIEIINKKYIYRRLQGSVKFLNKI